MGNTDAVASVGAYIFVAERVFAGIVGVGVAEREVKWRALVFPRNEEFFFLFGVEAVAVDVVNAVAEFQQESDLHGVLLESVADDGGKACLDFELAVAKDSEVGRVFAEYKHRNK